MLSSANKITYMMIQRYNVVTILGTFAHTTPEDEF